jgi:hypothetical protein
MLVERKEFIRRKDDEEFEVVVDSIIYNPGSLKG